jgi:hypothetical protein
MYIELFNDVFPYLADDDYYFTFFGKDLNTFDPNQQFLIRDLFGATYIKLRLSDVNRWSEILSNIFKERILIINDYQTSNKKIGKLYDLFKKKYRIPSNLLQLTENDSKLSFFLSKKEKVKYLSAWRKKSTIDYQPFTLEQFKFYLDISLQNQINDPIELYHYIDNGCFCDACVCKRKEFYIKALRNEPIKDKIIHENAVNQYKNKITESNNKKIAIINKINSTLKKSNLKNDRSIIKPL